MAVKPWLHNISREAYEAGLRAELAAATTVERKKAVQAELDALTKRTTVSPREGIETA